LLEDLPKRLTMRRVIHFRQSQFLGQLLLLLGGLLTTFPAPLHAESEMSTRSRIKIRKKSQLIQADQNTDEDYNAEKQEVLTRKRRSLMLDIKRFIRESSAEDQKAELNLRLGSLYMEDYYAGLTKAAQVFETDSADYKKNKNKKKKAPKLDNSEAVASLDRARVIYKDLLTSYPKHPRRDEMLYFSAVADLDKGNVTEGMSYFKMLSEQTPDSRYVNDALVQLGDYYFDANNFKTAEIYYDKIINRKYQPLIAYTVYKKAWCSYNQQKPQVALQQFKWVIENEGSGEQSSQVKIRAEAMRDITLPFVDLKMVNEGLQFFKTQGDPYFRRGVETMASLFYEQGNYRDSIFLYDTLLKTDANYIKNASYDISIIEGLKLNKDENGAIARLFARLPIYMENSNWYEINAAQPQVVKEAAKQFEETARKYAFQYHAEAQKTKSTERYNLAKQLYAKYLEFFPHTNYSAQVRFYMAEILYKQDQFVDAGDNYYQVYKDPSAGNLKMDSIRYALSSLDRQLNLDRKAAGLTEINNKSTSKLKETDETSLELTPYSDVETKFVDIATEYLSAYPTAKDGGDVLYEQAYLQYIHHDFAKSYKNFWGLIQKYPSHATSYSAGYLVLDILNRKKDYPKLILACQKFLTTPAFSKPQFRTEVADILRHSELKRIQMVEDKGEFKSAADAYVEYTKAYGHQDEALFEKALYNASVDYGKASEYLTAVETQEKFLRRFPKSALRETMLLQVAKTYELLAHFEKSAEYFEQFFTLYPKNVQSKNALRLAGLYYWGSGNSSKAETSMFTFIKTFPQDTQSVIKDLLDMYESQGLVDKQISVYNRSRSEKGIPIVDYVTYTVKMAELQGQRQGSIPVNLMDEALRVAERYQKDLMATPRGVEALSKLMFWFTKRKEDVFYSIKLQLPQRQLEVNLQRKLALLKELERDYTRTAGLGSGEWGLASIYKIAAAYRTLAAEVLSAPVPSELSAEQTEMYRNEIQKTIIKPFRERALQLVAQCLDKSQEFDLLSSWTPKCYGLASELDPARYQVVRTFYLPSMQLGVLPPTKGESKIALGGYKTYSYPFYSSLLFNLSPDRIPTSASSDLPVLYGEQKGLMDTPTSVPEMVTYRIIGEERKQILNHDLANDKPGDSRRLPTFSYLNDLRLTAPNRAVPVIMDAIQHDPQNTSLHNLLALTYLELNNYPAAKVAWLALVARGVKNAALWNNLGVLANIQGKEGQAIDYFSEATLMESPKEALANLGFIALKYRNGFEAKKHFEKAIAIEKNDVTTQVGFAVAELQNRQVEPARDQLLELSKKYKNDPYARLSLGYLLIDVEHENELARRLLSEYMDSQSVENDMQFRQAMQEAKRQISSGEELPGLNN
jgi:Tfp pilus assembly protein PilF/TolA-binding protein